MTEATPTLNPWGASDDDLGVDRVQQDPAHEAPQANSTEINIPAQIFGAGEIGCREHRGDHEERDIKSVIRECEQKYRKKETSSISPQHARDHRHETGDREHVRPDQ